MGCGSSERGQTLRLALDETHQGHTETGDTSSGFEWDASQVRDPAHMDRLLLVLQLAACFVLAQGVFVLQHRFRSILERPDRRTLSLFSLGLRWLDRARSHLVPLSFHLVFPFP